MFKNLQLVPGLIFALILSNAILPVRILQGQARDIINLIGSQIVIFILCMSCWLISVFILRSIKYKQWIKVLSSMLGCSLLSIVFYYSFHGLFEDYPLDPLSNYSVYIGVTRMAYRGILIGIILYPSAYFLDTQRRLHYQRIKLEQRKQQNLLAELNYLRQQMNPHFLFNALNVLKSGTNEAWVKEYTIQLAEVYRYFLTHHMDIDLVEVEEELAFIKTYIFMLKHRFTNGIDIRQQLTKPMHNAYLPPFAIQVLIENAIKHNTVSAKHPLVVSIYEEGDHIVVSNTKRKRFSDGTNGVGLQNLSKRYRLLSDQPILIDENEKLFTVKLPLLKK